MELSHLFIIVTVLLDAGVYGWVVNIIKRIAVHLVGRNGLMSAAPVQHYGLLPIVGLQFCMCQRTEITIWQRR